MNFNWNYPSAAPIGIFDSGVGGLSVLAAIRECLPAEPLVYVADQAHVPYGLRPLAEVQRLALGIARFLLARDAKMIVVACNTASAAALHGLRVQYPDVPFVGMEPAVKPAAATTRSGTIGVLATPATFQGRLFASVVERFANGKRVLQESCPGLVARIEAGDLTGPATRALLVTALQPLLAQGADTIVLGCTHYPFVMPLIRDIVGPHVEIIDPAPAVARRVAAVLDERGLRNLAGTSPAPVQLLTTGEPTAFAALAGLLCGAAVTTDSVRWAGDTLTSAAAVGAE